MTTHAVVGLLAHVDAGKTTLAEALLYESGAIRVQGRVDHGNSHLDFEQMERRRGITIFSKQARLSCGPTELTLIDTPGHVDFCAEAERTLQILDYAVLVIGAHEGVQGHTKTLWRLLARYGVPMLVFVNKMDLAGCDPQTVLLQLQNKLDASCLDYWSLLDPNGQEAAALVDELALDEYLQEGELSRATLRRLVIERKVFPCFFGSALKMEGTSEFLDALADIVLQKSWPEEFGARVYKVSHGSSGERITWLKVTGGVLRAKQLISGVSVGGGGLWEEKADQLRVYDGSQFSIASEMPAGRVCAVTGLCRTMPGSGLGTEKTTTRPALMPVLDYRVIPDGCDEHTVLKALLDLADEDPLLGAYWLEETKEVRVRLMGAIQQEVIQQTLDERYSIRVSFDAGSVLYKETIAAPVRGIGHFEPLRHYAEVHVLIEPMARGTGVTFATTCSEDELARNWQRLIQTHVMEREHRGVLIGAPITDVRITLVAGRAHPKHTVGGDFRQATYRAIRQGLMQAQSVLLEPWYHFELEVPEDKVGRAMADLQRMSAVFGIPCASASGVSLEGKVAVSQIRDYALEVRAYTRGQGALSLEFLEYDACQNATQVIEAAAYDAEADVANTPHSVFCSHGAGYTVPWNEVARLAHCAV
ncbi:MAG: TetM/TetW/TetO/TetS family tetracycline resistance ribosomal protection protein [Coriobacteriales bacterium]|nr:TetM/TetW/TetO/TetS family tetracycline resistance ribosomal protection protein [Coriobacteriales bacterium]